MPDFKDSYADKIWKSDVERYSRYKKMQAMLEETIANGNASSTILNFAEGVVHTLETLEEKYPSLKKG